MQANGKGKGRRARGPRRRTARYIFQVESRTDGTILRVMDTMDTRVCREIPIEEFLEYARRNKNVTPFLLNKLP